MITKDYICIGCNVADKHNPCRLSVDYAEGDVTIEPMLCPLNKSHTYWKPVGTATVQYDTPIKPSDGSETMSGIDNPATIERLFCAALLGESMETIQRVLNRFVHYRNHPNVVADIMEEWRKP
jgi:hypothetical protein